MTEQNGNRVTGKQVLIDAVTLAKDAGVFVYDLGKAVVVKIKNIVVTADKKKTDDKTDDTAKR